MIVYIRAIKDMYEGAKCKP